MFLFRKIERNESSSFFEPYHLLEKKRNIDLFGCSSEGSL
jgi:hypothetical protein